MGISLVSRCLRVPRAQLHVILRRTDDWMDDAAVVTLMIPDVLLRIHHVIGESCPRMVIVRVSALLPQTGAELETDADQCQTCLPDHAENALLLERKPAVPPSKQAHTGRVAVKKAISDGALTGPSSAVITERLRVTFALDCCDREALHWAVTT